jgi:periplasmic protein TonB
LIDASVIRANWRREIEKMMKHNFLALALVAVVAALLPSQVAATQSSPAKVAQFAKRPPMPLGAIEKRVTNDDYPASALARKSEGVVKFSLVIGENGRVSDCSIIKSSGDAALDSATCFHIKRRAKFRPATDENGNPTVGKYTGKITWRLPRD